MRHLQPMHLGGRERTADSVIQGAVHRQGDLHPAWHEFIRYCTELRYGEIERLSIQDGLPVLAEIVRKKVKFQR